MTCRTTAPFLQRLRQSTLLGVLVLLVVALRIGSAGACFQHEFAELGAAGQGHAIAAAIEDTAVPDGASAHAQACTHCSCHHAAAVPQAVVQIGPLPVRDAPHSFGASAATTDLSRNLRPPIA